MSGEPQDDRYRYRYRSRSRDRDRESDRYHDRDYDWDSYRRTSPPPRLDDDEYNRSRESSRPRGNDQSPRTDPGRPSCTLIVEGLPMDVTEDDIIDGFASVSSSSVFRPDDVKAVRLRNNRRGRRIGFVEFFKVSDAADFLAHHFPSLTFQLAHSRGVNSEPVSVGINYSRGREDDYRDDRGRDSDRDDWKCSECTYLNYGHRDRCYRCGYDRPDGYYHGREDAYAASLGPRLTGETDEDPQQFPSQYLVIRGLEPSVTEEVLAKGIKKLYLEIHPEPKKETSNKLKSTAPTANAASMGARPDSLRRVFLVRDRYTNDSMRYGFAEFSTLEDAQGAIAKFRASPKFTISSKPITVAFIHTGVFVPHTGRVTEENSRFVFNPVYNPDIFLKYWDSRVYPSILNVSVSRHSSPEKAGSPEKSSAPPADDAVTSQDAGGKKVKKIKMSQPQAKPALAMNPQMQMWAKKRAELTGSRDAGFSEDDDASLAGGDGSRPTRTHPRPEDTYISYSDPGSFSCLLCLRKFVSELALRDHEILSKEHVSKATVEEKRSAATERLESHGKSPQTITLRIARGPSHTPPTYTSYADRENLHCLICQRKFASAAHLSLHERESEMHSRNLADQANVDRAISQLAHMGRTPVKMVPSRTKGLRSGYRDRARERRQAFNQPKKPSGPKRESHVPKVADPEEEKAAVPSKGAALLGKMGWSAGEGLGAAGKGRTDVIATEVYAAGVGLGAEGSKLGDAAAEAARKTKDYYSDFVEQTKSKARERFEKLG